VLNRGSNRLGSLLANYRVKKGKGLRATLQEGREKFDELDQLPDPKGGPNLHRGRKRCSMTVPSKPKKGTGTLAKGLPDGTISTRVKVPSLRGGVIRFRGKKRARNFIH